MMPGCAATVALEADVVVVRVFVLVPESVGVLVATAVLVVESSVARQTARTSSPVRFEKRPVVQSPVPIQGVEKNEFGFVESEGVRGVCLNQHITIQA
jgi:hypothetical protein